MQGLFKPAAPRAGVPRRVLMGMLIRLAVLASIGIQAQVAAAQAPAFPTRPIHLVVPFPAGGAVDILGRLIGQRIGAQTGQAVIVDNRPGANGSVGSEVVARSPADGYTILFAGNGLATNSSVYAHRNFSELKDLTSIAYLGDAPLIMVVANNYPAKTLKDVIDAAKKDPNAVSYASAGYGSAANLSSEQLKAIAHVNILHVPYKGGAPAIVDLNAGRVTFMLLDPPQAMPQIQSGRLRGIVVGSNKRFALLPDAQTTTEAGYPNVDARVWWGFMAPAATPPAVVQKLNAEINQALASPDVQKGLASLGVTAEPGSPRQFDTYLRNQAAKWAAVVKQAGIKAD